MREAVTKVISGKKWICCPQCGRKTFPVEENTVIENLVLQCKESRCKLLFKVNI